MLTLDEICVARAHLSVPDWQRVNFSAVADEFRDAPEFVFEQAWLAAPETRFAPATARVLASASDLWIWADLTDDAPRNAATAPNQNTWELGDCFEIFLAPRAHGPYYEMHVTPENQTLQLQVEARTRSRRLENGPLRSATHLTATGWQVLAVLPLTLLEGQKCGWLSFGRYDYQSGQREPILSSTSLHREPHFHRREEWTPFELQLSNPKP